MEPLLARTPITLAKQKASMDAIKTSRLRLPNLKLVPTHTLVNVELRAATKALLPAMIVASVALMQKIGRHQPSVERIPHLSLSHKANAPAQPLVRSLSSFPVVVQELAAMMATVASACTTCRRA